MKKVRVKREMPFAEVGEEFEVTEFNCFDFKSVALHIDNVDEWIKDGWLEWVEEPKSFDEKILEVFFLNDHAHETAAHWRGAIRSDVKRVAKDHMLEVFDKAIDGINMPSYMEIRKALEEA